MSVFQGIKITDFGAHPHNASTLEELLAQSVNQPKPFHHQFFLEIFIVVALLSVAASLLTVFTIFRFQKLRKDVINIIIAHLSILYAFCTISTPLLTKAILSDKVSVTQPMACALYATDYLLLFAVCLFVCLLTCAWFLKLYYEHLYLMFHRTYKFFIGVIYAFVVFSCVLVTQICYSIAAGDIPLVLTVAFVCITFLIYVAIFLFLLVVNVVHFLKKQEVQRSENSAGLCIANIFLILWLPLLVLLSVMVFHVHFSSLVYVSALMLGISSPVFNVLYLYNYDSKFNIFFKKVLTYQFVDYKDELL